MWSLHKNIQLMLEFLKAPFLVLQFFYYTSTTVFIYCNIGIYADYTTLYSNYEVDLLFWKKAWFFFHHSRCCKHAYVNSLFNCTARFWNSLPMEESPPPLKIRGEAGFLFLKFGERGGSSKKILRNRLVKREVGVPLERERVPNCFISFPSEKHVFVTIGIIFLSGKYSLFL